MKKVLNLLLLASFLLTVLVPLTGVLVHKTAAALFLLLCLVHTAVHRRRLAGRRAALLAAVALAFASGLSALLWETPLLLMAHRALSAVCILGLAVHVVTFQRRLRGAQA